MRLFLIPNLVMAFLLAAVIVVAPVRAQSYEPQAEEYPALKMLQDLRADQPIEARLQRVDAALALLPQPTPLRGNALCLRASLLQELDRFQEAHSTVAQCLQLSPDDPMGLWVSIAVDTALQHPQSAAAGVARLAAVDVEAARKLEPSVLEGIERQLTYRGDGRSGPQMWRALAKSGWGQIYPVTFGDRAFALVLQSLNEGRREEAAALLPTILNPETGLKMLIDRRFEQMWPDIERWAGRDLAMQQTAMLRATNAVYRADPTYDKLRGYTEALCLDGRAQEAIVEVRKWLGAHPKADNWELNASRIFLARLLANEGQPDEGIAVLRSALGGADSTNIVPNLARTLIRKGDPVAALALLDERTPSETGVEAKAALGYFVALRACALSALQRRAEAQAAVDRTLSVYRNNRSAVAIAVACNGPATAIVAGMVGKLDDQTLRGDGLMQVLIARTLKRRGAALDPTGSGAIAKVVDSPVIAAAYARYARELPASYEPMLELVAESSR